MKASHYFLIAAAILGFPCALALSGSEPPLWALPGELLAIALGSTAGVLPAKEIKAEKDSSSTP